jgi:hypothetical protein
MATVSKRFRDNFETFAAHRIETGQFTRAEVDELKALIKIDLTPGPDQLRKEVFYLNSKGVKIPATIDDHEDRYRYWDEFFEEESKDIEAQRRIA